MSHIAVQKSAAARKLDSDGFLAKAQELVLQNFNAHRKADKVPELTLEQINITWFAKILGGWKCYVDSTVAKGLLWRVTYAAARDEIYLDVYTKLNNVKFTLAEDKAA